MSTQIERLPGQAKLPPVQRLSGQAQLPQSVGRWTGGTYLVIMIALALIAVGIYAYSRQLIHGEVVTGMRDVGPMGGASWGLYIIAAIYFIGASFAGITVAALIRLAKVEHLKPVARMAELLTVVTILLGGLSILVDVGQPLRAVVNLLRYARPQSPFFGTFTLVISGYLFASLVYLYLDGRRDASVLAAVPGRLQGLHRLWAAGYRDTPAERDRHQRTSLWLAIAIVPLLIAAHSTLGFVFGLQVGRPGWFSALQAPSFVILAGVSGVGLLIIIAAIVRQTLGAQAELPEPVFRWMGRFLAGLVLTYLYFMVVEWLTMAYASAHHEQEIMHALMFGEYASIYWVSVVSLALVLVLVILTETFARHSALTLWVISGLLANVAAVGKRYLIVVPSQTIGSLLPYDPGSYSPTWVEYSVILGLIGTGLLLFVVFMKVFPIIPLSHEGGKS